VAFSTNRVEDIINNEFAFNLLTQTQTPHDKWLVPFFVQHKTGWVVFEFSQPLLIRAVGLTSANDEHERDPKDLRISCVNFIDPMLNEESREKIK
jgi:hypothetical protein